MRPLQRRGTQVRATKDLNRMSSLSLRWITRLFVTMVSRSIELNETDSLASGYLLRMQDQERRRLARELHGTTGQNMAALHMNLSLLSASAGELEPRARRALADSVTLAQVCIREIRNLARALYPPLLDEAGLVTALRVYADDYSRRTGRNLDLDLPDRMDRLPQEVEITLFRIVQESLANRNGDAGGPKVVRLTRERDSLVLELAELAAAQTIAGVPEVQERARLLGGRLDVTPTSLRVILPASLGSSEKHSFSLDLRND